MPSSRFRIRQHKAPLRDAGIAVREYVPAIDKYSTIRGLPGEGGPWARPIYGAWEGAKLVARAPGVVGSWRGDVTWLERELLPGRPSLERVLGRPLVWDVDDAIWLVARDDGGWLRKIARRADVMVVVNDHVAEWFSGHARDIRVVPTAVDTDRWRPVAEATTARARFVVGWTGISTNFRFLQQIEEPLQRFVAGVEDAELLVVADRPPTLRGIPPEKVRFIPWSPRVEAEAVARMDVGIMPLADDEWSRGKGSFKMLQYMSCGLPVIASPVGMNASVLAHDEVGFPAAGLDDWTDALTALHADRELGRQMGRRGRAVVERSFSLAVIAPRLAGIFKEVAAA
ncbi:MAG: glycosyltransferase family 4 protein [Actinomycetota bacterium]